MFFRILSSVILIHLACLSATVSAQDCPCCSPEHHLFDFWLGSWTVYDSLDQAGVLDENHDVVSLIFKGFYRKK